MNFALSTIIIIILLLPGITCLNAFYNSFQEKSSNLKTPFNELFIKGVLISLFIHSIALCVIRLVGYEPSTSVLYLILSSSEIDISDYRLNEVFLQFATYNILINASAFLATKLVRRFISQQRIDLKYNSLKLYNHWYNIFSGRFLEMEV
jgi:hypothetical protein